MTPALSVPSEAPWKKIDADRVGVFLSVLCAIHCAATPVLLILLPTFGKIWSHPASHWGMALFVVPIAIAMLTSGYRRHRRRCIIATGSLGIALVIIGAILPYVEKPAENIAPAAAATSAPEEEEVFTFVVGEDDVAEEEEAFVYVKGQEMPETTCSTGCGAGCTDNCCPSLITDENGNTRLHIPPASIVTTLGGVALIITHIGNLCCCPACRRQKPLKK